MVQLRRSLGLGVSGAVALLVLHVSAIAQIDQRRLPNFDVRSSVPQQPPGAIAAQQRIATSLKGQAPNFQIDFDELLATPAFVRSRDGYLTGPKGEGNTIGAATAQQVPADDPHRPLKNFLNEYPALFGHGAEVLSDARTNRDFVAAHSGMRTVVWQQQVDDIPVFEAILVAHTTKRGELVNVSSSFLPDARRAADAGLPSRASVQAAPPISAQQTVAVAAQNVGETLDAAAVSAVEPAFTGVERHQRFRAAVLLAETDVRLVWLPMDRAQMRLCWEVILTSRARGEMFRVLVDAQTGECMLRHGLTEYISDATYNVFTSDSPSPYSPACPTPCTAQPSVVSRSLVVTSAVSTLASPNGWINDGDNTTLGNNVDAHLDKNADNVPDTGSRPTGSPFRVFDFPMDLAQEPVTYTNAAVVQLFYWNNWMHDKLYELGFTEAAGNFQTDNFGRGGYGNDAVQADAQDGSGYNNANFSTPPDGSPGRMQMFLFNGPTPDRDGDFDADVVLHEYTHGLSNRRVGGGVGISALQSGGMGEGWSDFYALSLLSEPADDVNGNYAAGGYVTYQLSGMTQNYYFGIRRYPYSTDMTKNPLTFKDIDPAQASSHTGIPRSSIVGTTANEVHNMGEVWCVTLWDARAKLINKYGWTVGNQLILQLVTDGMNLAPANPNFLQARDAIIQADQVDTGGANRNDLWAAFAKRGMGYSATSPASSTTAGLVEAYDFPDFLKVTPASGLNSSGAIGGPFNPSAQTYVLANAGTITLNWAATKSAVWLDLSSTSGTLQVGNSNTVAVSINAAANGLAAGNYSDTVTFSNLVSGMIQTRTVALTVTPPRLYFFPLDTDPGWSRQGEWAFGKPAGLGGTSHGRPDPTSGATATNVFGINLNGDYSIAIGGPYYLTAGPLNFGGYTGAKLQFQRWLNTDYPSYVYATIEVSSNGTTWTQIFSNSSGVEIADTAWNKYQYDISAIADNQTNVYVRWGHRVGSAGAYAYSGWNIDDIEFLASPSRLLKVEVPVAATEGDGVLMGNVTVTPAPTNNLTITLSSSDTSEVMVPPTVIVLAGQTNATFDLPIVDDTVLDGDQSAIITAAASGYLSATKTMVIHDNETATLTVTAPASVTEGQGTLANAGTIAASAPVAANVTVNLTSSDTTEITVPSAVTILSGQTSAAFNITVVDDTQIDGSQMATITAHVASWTDGSASLAVLDNENTNLTVGLPISASEGDGVLANAGRVGISGSLASNLTVTLQSSDTTALIVPASVTILAGQTNATFNLTIVDDTLQDGTQMAVVIASATGFNNGSATMAVLDNDAHHVTLGTIASPQSVGTPFSVTITAQDVTNATVSGFRGPVSLSGVGNKGAVLLTPTNTGTFTAGQWIGNVTVGTLDSNIVLTASDGSGHTGLSNPFDMKRAVGSFFIPATNRVDMVHDAGRGYLYITAGNQVLRYNLASGSFLAPFVFGSSLMGIDISLDGNTLAVADNAYAGGSNWVYLVDLPTGTNQQVRFPLAFYEGGTYAVAFGSDGAVIISSRFQGSGWVPMRRYDPITGNVKTVANPRQDSMVSSSGDGLTMAVVEANISSGPLNRYNVTSQMISGTIDTGWFTFEGAVNRNGTQFAVPTYGGTFIYDESLRWVTTLGTYASEGPIGLAYHPQEDLVFFAWCPTPYIRMYETHTMAEVARYDCQYNFGWTGNGAFQQGRARTSRDGDNVFVTVANGVRWISRATDPPADLTLSVQDTPDPVMAGSNLTYMVTVTNKGPNGVTDARVFDRLSAGVSFVSATASQGTCTLSNGLVVCTLGALSAGADTTISIVVTPPMESVLTNIAAVVSSASDPNSSNNAATAFTTVQGVASLAVLPATNFVATGTTGGPFNPSSQVYTLTNNGTTFLNWSVSKAASWVSLSATNGTLAPNAATTITVSISSAANALPAGNYTDSITFVNLTNGTGSTTRGVSLTIIPVGILGVTPSSGLASTGPRGGLFSPMSQSYALTNSGDGSLNWIASNSTAWVSLSPANGTLAAGAAGTLVVSINSTATNLARGAYSDTVNIVNTSSGRGNTTRGVTLTANTAPTATPQTVTLAEDTSAVVTLQGADLDGDALTAIITALPLNGTLYQTTDGTNPSTPITSAPTTVTHLGRKVVYKPAQDGNGNGYGNFQFKVNDGLTDSTSALVTVNVTPVNDAPVAGNDKVNFIVGTPQVVFNVLLNDMDVDGDSLTVQSFTTPTRGVLTQVNNGQFTYQPGITFTNGEDQFSYTINDGHGATATAQVTIKAHTGYLSGGDWPTFGNGPSHTGYYPGLLGGNILVASWSTNFGVALNQVAVGAGKVYVTPVTYFGGTYLAALDAVTGQAAWRHDFTSAFSINPPTFNNGRVFVQRGNHSSDTQLWCINGVDGAVVWSAPHQAQWERYYAPTIYGDGIWVDGGYYGGMYGFSTNGAQRFFYSALAQYDQWTPTYYEGTVYSWVEGVFRAHNSMTGSNLWSVSVGWNWDGWSMNTASAIDGGRAFVQRRPDMFAIDLSTHTNVWMVTGGMRGSPAAANGLAYAIVGDEVRSFAAGNGALLGSYKATNDTGLAWQPIVTDDALLVASSSSTYIFDLASHQLIQTIPYGGTLSVANGRLYIAGSDGALRAYAVDANQPADLLASVGAAPEPVTVGSNLTYSVLVTNAGPNSASGVVLTDLLPASVTFVSATSSQGSCTQIASVVICNLDTLLSGSTASATIVVVPTMLGMITNSAVVSATTVDPNPADNSALTASSVKPRAPVMIAEPPVTLGTSNTVCWSAVAGADQYEAQVDTSPQFTNPTSSGWITATCDTFAGLADGVHYYYRVRARKNLPATLASWTQTTQADFDSNIKSNVSTTAKPGDVVLTTTNASSLKILVQGDSVNGAFLTDLIALGHNVTTSSTLPADLSPFDVIMLTATVGYNISSAQIDAYTSSGRGLVIFEEGVYVYHVSTGAASCPVSSFNNDWMVRSNAAVVNPDSPIVIGLPTNSTLFGISMTPTIKSGANVVIRWQDGTPMAVTCTNGGGKIVFINDFWSWYGFSWRGDHSFGTNLIDKILTYIASRSAYAPYGNIISLPIAPVLFDKWDAVAFTKDISSAGTALTVDVLATNDVLLAANVTNGANLASLPAVVSQTAIKLRANLSTSDSTNTPKLSDWSVTFLTTADTALISIWSNISDSIQDANGTIDSDADGLPDFWEWQYFGSLNAPNGAPNADPDGDGQNNQTEFLAGTNPTNSISYWRIQASPTNGVAPLFVGFSENSMGLTITNRMWNFGDGTTSSAISPNHSYTNSGTFSVGLTIFNVHGTATLVASNLITVSPPPVPYPQAVTNAGPIAYWRLNETNGATVAVDFLGFHNGTISANVTPGVSGPQSPLFPGFETNNTAIRFNCVSGSYLTMPALNLNTNTVTITGWINPTGNQPGWAPIAFCRDGNTVAGLHFGSESIANELRYSWNNSRWDKSTGLVVPTGQWSFVALVVTPTNGTVYLGTNGILRAFTDVASEPNQAFGTSLLIGYDPSQGSRLFRGAIDEVAIYNHSLTPTQIQQLYTSGLTTPPPPLTAFQTWQFQHFGCTNCLQAAENADPDGDGQNNFAEFMAGTDPLSAASAFRILWLAPEGDNVRITWATAGGRTNAVQAAINDADGCYTTNFIDLSGSIIILGSGDATTNYLDVSGATNAPARFYRIRLVP